MSFRRIAVGLWICLFPFLLLLLLWPVNSRSLRLGTVGVVLALVLGSLWFSSKRPKIMVSLLVIYALLGGFLAFGGHRVDDVSGLRELSARQLDTYQGVSYVWGGEGRLGIDCSGLVRRGFLDTLMRQGVMTANPYLIRAALDLWWNDTTAMEIGNGYGGRTMIVTECASLNELDHSRIRPGDMAVTTSGVHIMAYLGNRRWIGADPGEMKVAIFEIPEVENGWFSSSMKILRWKKI